MRKVLLILRYFSQKLDNITFSKISTFSNPVQLTRFRSISPCLFYIQAYLIAWPVFKLFSQRKHIFLSSSPANIFVFHFIVSHVLFVYHSFCGKRESVLWERPFVQALMFFNFTTTTSKNLPVSFCYYYAILVFLPLTSLVVSSVLSF